MNIIMRRENKYLFEEMGGVRCMGQFIILAVGDMRGF